MCILFLHTYEMYVYAMGVVYIAMNYIREYLCDQDIGPS